MANRGLLRLQICGQHSAGQTTLMNLEWNNEGTFAQQEENVCVSGFSFNITLASSLVCLLFFILLHHNRVPQNWDKTVSFLQRVRDR